MNSICIPVDDQSMKIVASIQNFRCSFWSILDSIKENCSLSHTKSHGIGSGLAPVPFAVPGAQETVYCLSRVCTTDRGSGGRCRLDAGCTKGVSLLVSTCQPADRAAAGYCSGIWSTVTSCRHCVIVSPSRLFRDFQISSSELYRWRSPSLYSRAWIILNYLRVSHQTKPI